MSNAKHATTSRTQKPARAVRLPASVADNTNGTPPVTEAEPPQLTPALVRAVLREVERAGDDDRFAEVVKGAMDDDDAAAVLLAGLEAEAAVTRARSARTFVAVCIEHALPGWVPARVDGELPPDTQSQRELDLERLRHCVYAVLGGAYDTPDHDSAFIERLMDDCERVSHAYGAEGDRQLVLAGHLASDLVFATWAARARGDADPVRRRNCLVFATQGARRVAKGMIDSGRRAELGAFIDALRAIPAATVQA